MLVSWSATPFLTFAGSLNSLSPLCLESEIDSEFKKPANGTPAEIFVTAGGILRLALNRTRHKNCIETTDASSAGSCRVQREVTDN